MGCKITQYKVEKGVFIEVNFTVYNNDVHGFSFIVININASKVMLNGTYCLAAASFERRPIIGSLNTLRSVPVE